MSKTCFYIKGSPKWTLQFQIVPGEIVPVVEKSTHMCDTEIKAEENRS